MKHLSLYILIASRYADITESNKILSEWLNNIVRGRLMYQMSTARESQKQNDKRVGALFSKIDINMNLDPHGRFKGRFFKMCS